MARILKLRDANVYINGTSTHGEATEVTLPNVQHIKSEHKALGMVGVLKYFQGVEAMDATVKWSSPDNDVKIACANPMKSVNWMVRANRDVLENGGVVAQEPVIVYLKGTINNYGLGSMKAKEDTETETKIDVHYIKEVCNGQEILEIDVLANIFRIAGVDIMTQYRKNLGI